MPPAAVQPAARVLLAQLQLFIAFGSALLICSHIHF